MNEEFEMVGVIGTEKFPQLSQMWDGQKVHQALTEERIVPMMFKELLPGTQLFMKKVKE